MAKSSGSPSLQQAGVERLRAWGLGEQALKTALAAGLSWALGGLVPGAPPDPYLAPLTAVLTVQLTIADSVTGAVQRTIGAAVGVIVALLAGQFIGVNALTVALLVLFAQAIGAILRLTLIGTSQVVVTALLVLTLGGSTNVAYAWSRIVETLVGALVGVGVNALLVPPTHLPAVAAAMSAVITSLRERMKALEEGLAQGLTSDAARENLEQARLLAQQVESTMQALQRAEDSMRFNPLGARERDRLDVYRRRARSLERNAIQVRTIARGLSDAMTDGRPVWLEPQAFGRPIANLIKEVRELLDEDDHARTHAEIARSRAAIVERVQADESRALLIPDGWVRLASMLATLDRLAADLGAPGREPNGEEEDE